MACHQQGEPKSIYHPTDGKDVEVIDSAPNSFDQSPRLSIVMENEYLIECWVPNSVELVMKVILLLNGAFGWELVPYDFPLVDLDTKWTFFLSTCGASLEVVFEFEGRATYSGSLRAKLILAPSGMPKWVWPSRKQYRMFFFVRTSTLPPNTHGKPTEHGGLLYGKQPTPNQRLCWVRG